MPSQPKDLHPKASFQIGKDFEFWPKGGLQGYNQQRETKFLGGTQRNPTKWRLNRLQVSKE